MKKVLGFMKKHKKALIITAILAVVIFFIVKVVISVNDAMNMFGGMQNSASTEAVERTDIVNSVTATGKIVPVEKRTLSSTITGVTVKELNVSVGDQVQPGDLICLLDDSDLSEQLSDAQTMLSADSSKASLEVQSSNRSLGEAVESRDVDAKRSEQDKSDAYNKFSSAANECQEAKDAYDSACGTTGDLKGKMDAAKRELDNANNSGVHELTDAEKVAALDPYAQAFTRLESYISGLNPTDAALISSTWKDTLDPISVGQINVSGTSVSMIYNGDNPDVSSRISSSLSELNSCWSQYQSALSLGSEVKKANVAAAEAAYQTAKANYEAALAKEESLKATYESKVKTVESYYDSFNQTVRNADDKKRSDDSQVAASAENLKRNQLNASTATVSEKRNVDDIQERIDSCEIRANIGGVVTAVDVVLGDYYNGGAIVTIENTSDYEVSAQIDEYEIGKVKVGQEVIIKTNGTGTQEFKGVVKSVAPHATESVGSNAVKYEVVVSVLDHCDEFKLDMTAKIEIISEKKEAVLAVPSEAIMEDDDGNFYVEVLDGGTTIDSSNYLSDPSSLSEEDLEKMKNGENTYESHKVFVTKGIVGDYYTEIWGDGIEEGLKIVIPNEGIMSDLDAYMEESGATGGF